MRPWSWLPAGYCHWTILPYVPKFLKTYSLPEASISSASITYYTLEFILTLHWSHFIVTSDLPIIEFNRYLRMPPYWSICGTESCYFLEFSWLPGSTLSWFSSCLSDLPRAFIYSGILWSWRWQGSFSLSCSPGASIYSPAAFGCDDFSVATTGPDFLPLSPRSAFLLVYTWHALRCPTSILKQSILNGTLSSTLSPPVFPLLPQTTIFYPILWARNLTISLALPVNLVSLFWLAANYWQVYRLNVSSQHSSAQLYSHFLNSDPYHLLYRQLWL